MATSPDDALMFEPTASLPVLTDVYPLADDLSARSVAPKVESGHVKLELDNETKQKTLDQRLKKFI